MYSALIILIIVVLVVVVVLLTLRSPLVNLTYPPRADPCQNNWQKGMYPAYGCRMNGTCLQACDGSQTGCSYSACDGTAPKCPC